MALNYVLDTNVILYHLAGRLVAPLPAGAVHVSVVTEIELLSYPNLTPSEEAAINAYLATTTIVDLLPSIKPEAIRLRKVHKLKLPDAIVAATALILQATLITNDSQLKSLSGLTTQQVAVT
jgi:predicted nucleic acid-binding protein